MDLMRASAVSAFLTIMAATSLVQPSGAQSPPAVRVTIDPVPPDRSVCGMKLASTVRITNLDRQMLYSGTMELLLYTNKYPNYPAGKLDLSQPYPRALPPGQEIVFPFYDLQIQGGVSGSATLQAVAQIQGPSGVYVTAPATQQITITCGQPEGGGGQG